MLAGVRETRGTSTPPHPLHTGFPLVTLAPVGLGTASRSRKRQERQESEGLEKGVQDG